MLTNDGVNIFKNEGWFLQKNLLDEEETNLLQRIAKSNTDLNMKSHIGKDKDNCNVRLTIWNHPGDSIFGTIARSKRVVDSMEQILGGEVYHWHSEMMIQRSS